MQNSPQDLHKKVLGRKGEKLVEQYLKKQGCKLLEKNYKTPFGEADLIVLDGEEIAFVGDRLETDIAIGVKNGLKAVLVYTGVTTPEMYEKSDIKATVAFENIGELGKALI